MPRTPLLQSLHRIAVAAARDQPDRPSPDPSRRAVLRGAAALGAAAAAAAGMSPAPAGAAELRVAIVGAGLAGLTAAYQLRQAGIAARVFEASSRLGGRCFSIRNVFDQGQIAEHGGEFIDTGHMAIRWLVHRLGLKLDDVLAAQPAGTQPLYFFGGAPYTHAEATADFQPVYPILQQQSAALGSTISYRASTPFARWLDRRTIADWVALYVPGGTASRLGQLIDSAFTEENAAEANQQSAISVVSVLAADARDNFNLYYTSSDQRFHVRGGNDQIVSRLAAQLPGQIEPGRALVGVTRQGDGSVRLTLARGAQVTDAVFDRVILALPFAVMRESVDLSAAGFRPLKLRAIRTMGMGASVKFQLQFNRRRWYELGCSGEIRLPAALFQTSWDVTRAQPGEHGVFNFWSGGNQAIRAGRLDQQLLAQLCMQRAEAILPGLSPLWNGRATRDVWKDNPWSRGSYAFYGPGYYTEVSGIEPEPEGNCFFAGEHTEANFGYLNAGVSSGLRAARQVIASLPG